MLEGEGEATGVPVAEPMGVPLLAVVWLATMFSVEIEIEGSGAVELRDDVDDFLIRGPDVEFKEDVDDFFMRGAGGKGRFGGAGPTIGRL